MTCYVEQPYTTQIIPIEDTAKLNLAAPVYEASISFQSGTAMLKRGLQQISKRIMYYTLVALNFSFPSKEVIYEKYEEVDKEYNAFVL